MTEDRKSVLTIRVPRGLKARIEKYSVLEGVSINQFALYAFAKEIAQLETNRYFRERLRGKSKEDLVVAFDAALAKVPDRKSPKWDRLPGAARRMTPDKKVEQSRARRRD